MADELPACGPVGPVCGAFGVRLGLMGARADRRGLAVQTLEFARHMRPDRILGIEDPQSPAPDWSGWPTLWGTVGGRRGLDERTAAAFLTGLDVVWAAETFYHEQFCRIAATAGVRTVLHANPEFFGFDRLGWPRPDVVLNPTSWLNERLSAKVFPFPVDRDRCQHLPRPLTDPVRFLHVVGQPAMHDRAGTQTLLKALTLVRRPVDVTIRTQGSLGVDPRPPGHVTLAVEQADVADYWRLYDGFDVLVLPRRYGGQSLAFNEAASCGLAVVATDVEPQTSWLHPAGRIPVRRRRSFRGMVGPVPMVEGDPRALAAILDLLSTSPQMVADMSAHSDRYAEGVSWGRLGPEFRQILTA